ncbi:MAG: SDR family oxidoreductase [Dactylosporangium sp.]|nr:SDR family oxidoreductase [Dactylosporangium sp.]NNJ60049.1 SDR family oxidoreductase [Dactylosporangium sp.]
MSTEMVIPEPTPLGAVLSLHEQCAVVIGGSRGLGAAIVGRLAEAGAAVVFTGRRQETLQPVADAVAAAGGTAVPVAADVGEAKESRRVIDLAVRRFGRVDILVNNAAVFEARIALETTEELWDRTHDIDLKGAFFATQAAAQAMIAGGRGGRIVNILSTDAFRPMGMLVAYDAAKAGLDAVTRSLAKELAPHRILVNSVAPGATITTERIAAMAAGTFGSSMVSGEAAGTREAFQTALAGGGVEAMLTKMPLSRPGYPHEIADAVLFLASGLSTYVSGVCLTVDGAQTLR